MRTYLPRLGRAVAVVALVAIPLAACSGDDDGGNSTATTADDGTVAVTAEDSLKFDPADLTADAGAIHFELDSSGSLPHTFLIEDHESDLKLSVTGGSSDDGTITLERGTYTFYCDIAGHRAAGMEGTLTVR